MGSRTVLGLSYQLLTSRNCNSQPTPTTKSRYDRLSVGQCVLVSSTHLGPKTRFLLLSDSCGFVDVVRSLSLSLSDERTGLLFKIAASLRQHSHSRFPVPRDSWPYFTVSDSRLPQPGGPGPRNIAPARTAQKMFLPLLHALSLPVKRVHIVVP
jgi:hypothetical protein